jgi:CRP-like cAMP-binding protein
MRDKTVELELDFADGEVIVTEGDRGSEMFIIQEGKVEVSRVLGGQTKVLAILDRGEFFGEMSVLEGEPRSATVRAIGKTKVMVLKQGGLLLKIRRDPTFAIDMLQHMSHRLRYLNEEVAKLLATGGAAVPKDELRAVVETSVLEAVTGSGS